MLNIEKFKEDIIERGFSHVYMEHHNGKDYDYDEDIIDWLCEEYKEPILDDIEKEYLSAVIKPFKNKVKCITKQKHNDEEYIVVCFEKTCMNFPKFPKGYMYKGMELLKFYSLEELGL